MIVASMEQHEFTDTVFVCFSLKPVLSTAPYSWLWKTSSGETSCVMYECRVLVVICYVMFWPPDVCISARVHDYVSACVSDRSILKQAEGVEPVKHLIQTFTSCFLRELALLQNQVGLIFSTTDINIWYIKNWTKIYFHYQFILNCIHYQLIYV